MAVHQCAANNDPPIAELGACIDDLGPSAKLVFRVLDYEGPLTQRELAEMTLLSQRTVRKALRRLDCREEIDERLYVPDGRQRLYEIQGRSRDREE